MSLTLEDDYKYFFLLITNEMSMSSSEAGVTIHVLVTAGHGVHESHMLIFFTLKSNQAVILQG